MSFSSNIKEELCRIRVKDTMQKKALLCGLTQTCATLRVSRTPAVIFQSESDEVIRLVSILGSSLYQLDATAARKQQEHRRKPLSTVTFSGTEIMKFLVEMGILREDSDGISFEKHIPAQLIEGMEEKKHFIRGAFLGSGSCSNPAAGYHLEIVCHTEAFAKDLAELITFFGPKPRISQRHEVFPLYLRGDDQTGFLALVGANNATLELENKRAERELRNYYNRRSNCETANIGKTVFAGMEQIEAIEAIEQKMGIRQLPGPLQEAAVLRLAHPDATLQELADIAEIGKSGMNHRLTRLIRIAKELEV